MSEHESWVSPTSEPGDFATSTTGELAEMFRLLDLRHALTGGHAVNQQASPRLTYDLDFVVGGGVRGPARCERMLRLLGYTMERAESRSGAGDPGFVRVKHPGRGVVVDIQEARTPFERSLLDRAVTPGDLPFPVATAEDLVVSKLISDRQRDQRDVLELAALPGLDTAYIRVWAERWQVLPAFERFFGDAGADAHGSP